MENCVFCKMVKGEIKSKIIWENDKYLAFLDQMPVKPGHTLIIPKKHTDYIFDLEDSEYSEIFLHAKDLAKKLKKALNPKRVGIVVEGFGVPHVHVHLVPIDKTNELSPEKAVRANEEELEKILKIINA